MMGLYCKIVHYVQNNEIKIMTATFENVTDESIEKIGFLH